MAEDLTPVTREEGFLNGNDIEPVTRKERILSGQNIEPVTRMEYFLKKAAGSQPVYDEVITVSGAGSTTKKIATVTVNPTAFPCAVLLVVKGTGDNAARRYYGLAFAKAASASGTTNNVGVTCLASSVSTANSSGIYISSGAISGGESAPAVAISVNAKTTSTYTAANVNGDYRIQAYII